jgi:hypothetical protein
VFVRFAMLSSLYLRLYSILERFLESLVSLRRWQKTLVPADDESNNKTRINQWLRQSYQHVLSLLPIYYDRARVTAGTLYHLDTAAATMSRRSMSSISSTSTSYNNSNNLSLDDCVLEFLKRQERLGGPPTAVALVLDAAGTSNWHPERGFRLSADNVSIGNNNGDHHDHGGDDGNTDDNARALLSWPAMYLRTTGTLHSNITGAAVASVASPRNSLTKGYYSTVANTSSSSPAAASLSRKGPFSGYYTAGTAATSSSTSNSPAAASLSRKGPFSASLATTATLPEYGVRGGRPDSSHGILSSYSSSWPLSCWEALVTSLLDHRDRQLKGRRRSGGGSSSISSPAVTSVLSHQQHPGVAVTYRETEEQASGQEESSLPKVAVPVHPPGHGRWFSAVSTPPLPPTVAQHEESSSSSKVTFHIVSLSEWITMVVVVKKEEDEEGEGGRWQPRRRSELSDEDIQEFLNLMATKLRVKDLFSFSNLPPSQLPTNNAGEPLLSFHGPDDSFFSWTNDSHVQRFVRDASEQLGWCAARKLLTVDENGTDDRTSRANPFPTTPLGALPTNPSDPTTAPRSAAALFLGPELSHLLD